MVKIAPSILSADFSQLGAQVREADAAGADYIHFDVMDGHFVPNITIGPMVAEAVRRVTSLPIDVHLMIEEPERYFQDFAHAGASILTVHQEVCRHLHRSVEHIKEVGCRAGVVINPATPLVTLEEILPFVDLVLIMTVNPGFGGQSYIPTGTAKIARLRRYLDEHGLTCELEVDGGINEQTVGEVTAAGADVLVAGTAVFHGGSIRENIRALRAGVRPRQPDEILGAIAPGSLAAL